MKKLLSIFLAAIMLSSFTACSQNQSGTTQSSNETTTIESTQPTTEEEEKLLAETDELKWSDYKVYNLKEDVPVKNIVLMIGDGMGENIIKASEIVKGDKLTMSGLPHKTHVITSSLSVEKGYEEFTDSAASATAISTGVKTYNQYIGVDGDGNNLETICEYAKKLGLKTGLVDRHYVFHATPAGMVAHNISRHSSRAILREMIESHVNVMFGGGSGHYTTSTSVKRTVKENDYTYISTEEELLALKAGDDRILGMFSHSNMGPAGMNPSLTTMTAKALELLDNDDGFFLMVEGSNIDVYAAEEDMASTLEQMQSFDLTTDYVLDWAEDHPGTLVIVTADHETGGVEIPENATAEDIDDSCFTSGGEHTNRNVLLMAGGAQSAGICEKDLIDNTDIAKYMRKVLADSHKTE